MGPSIDFRSARRGDTARQSKRLRDGSYMSIELNSLTAVPEWEGQEVGARATDSDRHHDGDPACGRRQMTRMSPPSTGI